MNGIEKITFERIRQIEVECFTPDYDSQFMEKELQKAAWCYFMEEKERKLILISWWPFEKKWWKPSPENRVRELTKAGALFKADYDLTNSAVSFRLMNICAEKIDLLNNP